MAESKSDKAPEKVHGPAPKPEPRMHVVPGRIPRKVLRTFYDAKQDCVIDEIEIPKIVQNRRGEDVDVTITRLVFSRDEALQAKYRRGDTPQRTELEEIS
jgi:hypothetical protein